MEKYSPQHPAQVRRQSLSQYESIYDGYANARRSLYPYEVAPWEEREPYNIWEDMAGRLNSVGPTRIVDIGSNDGYFHSILRHKGFAGEYVGIDKEGKDLPAVEYIAKLGFPGMGIRFIEGDGEDLKEVIEDNSTPAAATAFVPYHVGKPGKLLSELHRILEPDGIGLVASRNETNQQDIWEIARVVAHSHGFAFPQEVSGKDNFIPGVPITNVSVYSHFNVKQTEQALKSSKKFKIVYRHLQESELWIPTDTETGLDDIERAIESLLPYTIRIKDGEDATKDDVAVMANYVQTIMRGYFVAMGEKTRSQYNLDRPYYKSYVSQAFFIVRARK